MFFRVKHLHPYLYGCKFTCLRGHKLLMTILGPYHAIPTLSAVPGNMRWAIIFSVYNYGLHFWHSEEHAKADSLSWLSVNVSPGAEQLVEAACFNLG